MIKKYLGVFLVYIPLLLISQKDYSQKITTLGHPDSLERQLNFAVEPHDSIKPVQHTTSFILAYFLSEAQQIQYASIHGQHKKSIRLWQIDSFPYFIKSNLDSFIFVRNSMYKLNYSLQYNFTLPNSMHDSLEVMYNYSRKRRDSTLLKKIKLNIDLMPNSAEKVNLFLQYASLKKFNNDIYFNQIDSVLYDANLILNQISDPLELINASANLGLFAQQYNEYKYSVRFYYAARTMLKIIPLSDSTKNLLEGILCEKIATLFEVMSEHDTEKYIYEKISDYLGESNEYLSKSSNDSLSYLAWARKFSNDTYWITNILSRDSLTDNTAFSNDNLNSLYWWYFYFKKGGYDYAVNYLGLFNVGKWLIHTGYLREGLKFYLLALPYALESNQISYVDGCLSNIVFVYEQLKDEKQYNFYLDLMNSFQVYYSGTWGNANNLILRAEHFYYGNNLDSSLIYLNLFLHDSTFQENLDPTSFALLYKRAVELKYPILYAIKNDSALYFENEYNRFQQWSTRQLSDFYNAEAESRKGYQMGLTYINDSLVLQTMSLYRTRDSLERISQTLHSAIVNYSYFVKQLTERTNFLNEQISGLILKNLREKGIIKVLNAEITNKNLILDSLERIASNLSNTNRIISDSLATKQKELKIKSQEVQSLKRIRSNLFTSLLVIGAAALTLLFVSLVLARKNRKLKGENTELDIQNRKLKGENTELDIQNRKLKGENTELDIQIAKKQKIVEEKDLEKKFTEQKLLNDTALSHDLLELIVQVPIFVQQIENKLPIESNAKKIAREAYCYADEVSEYFSSNFELKGELLNTVSNEIDLAIKYLSLWEQTKGYSGKASINIIGLKSMSDIKIPKHTLVNFISNSLRHGSIGKDKITITVIGSKTNSGYVITVEDDGVGLEKLSIENKKDNRGIKLLLKQVENYNSINTNPFKIEFTIADIQNKLVNGKSSGVVVTYKINNR